MVNYRELYDSIKNPLDNPEIMMKLIEAYAKSSQAMGGMYDKLTKTVVETKKYAKGQHYRADADRFYSMLFNKWKNSIVNMSQDRFMELRRKGSYKDDFRKLRTYLKSIPDIRTKKEADSILFGEFDDKELQSAMNKYRWNAFGEASGWVHVCSRYLTAKKDKFPNATHRLYLDTESPDTYKMISALVEKFEEHQLPYYFKFDEYGNRDDTIVMYSDSENLSNYIEVLQEIKRENPELIGRLKDPPILTGKIDGWIGYGSEPEVDANGKKTSFNSVRSKVVESAISKLTKQWIMDHRNMRINYNGQSIKFEDYIAQKATDIELKQLQTSYTYKPKRETNEDVARRKGYTYEDLQNPQFKQKIYSVIKSHINTNLPIICNGKPSDVRSVMLNVRNGKQISLRGDLLDTAIKEISVKIAKNDKNFLANVRQEIEKEAQQYGIDIDKFCFDTKVRDALFAKDKENEQQPSSNKEEQPVRESSKIDIPKETAKKTPKKIEKIESIRIVDYLNPFCLERMMKLPNGVEIPATQYIQEVVAPHIPASGKFILKNGAEITAEQFIEENVMFEGQEKYNGDILALLDATTIGQALPQENGTQINSAQQDEIMSEEPKPIEEQGQVKLSDIKKGLNVSDVTIDEIKQGQKEISGRNEDKKSMLMGKSKTEEQEQDLQSH